MPSLLSSSAVPPPRSHRVAVALIVLEEHFGDIVRDVASLMLEIDQCTLPMLLKTAAMCLSAEDKLSPKQVRQALLVLWKHNCLVVEFPAETDLSEVALDAQGLETKLRMSGLLYALHVDSVLARLRFSKLLGGVGARHGVLGELVVEALALHGRLRFASVAARVRERLLAMHTERDAMRAERERERDAQGAEGEEDEGEGEEEALPAPDDEAATQRVFEALVQTRFITLVPPLDVKKRALFQAETASKSAAKRLSALFADHKTNGAGGAQGGAAGAAQSKAAAAKRARAALEAEERERERERDKDELPVELRLLLGAEEGAPGAGIGATTSAALTSGEHGVVRRSARFDSDDEWDESGAPPAAKKAARETAPGGAVRGAAGRGGRGRGRGRGASIAAQGAGAGKSENLSLSTVLAQSRSEGATAAAQMMRADAYWMIGAEQLVREERHAAVRDIVTDQLEGVAGAVVKVILANSMSLELGANPPRSQSMSLQEIHSCVRDELASSSADSKLSKIDIATLKKLLDVMRLSSLSVIQKVSGTDNDPQGASYLVNYEGVVAALRRRTIHQIAVQRFGTASGRIVELLQRNKFLEQQTVGERAILPARETRERLYRLMLDRWVNYVELSKRGDFNPSTNQYFWHLDLPRLKVALLDHLYHSLLNLLLRRRAELAANEDLLLFAPNSAADQARREELEQKMELLDSSVRGVDSTILLMEKF